MHTDSDGSLTLCFALNTHIAYECRDKRVELWTHEPCFARSRDANKQCKCKSPCTYAHNMLDPRPTPIADPKLQK